MGIQFRRRDNLKATVAEDKIGTAIRLGFQPLGDALIASLAARSPVDRGTYKKGHRGRLSGRGLRTRMLIFNVADHAEWVEKGRKPGSKAPPVAVMLAFVKRKGIGAKAFSVKTRRGISAGTKRTVNRTTGKRRTAGQSYLQNQRSAAFAIGRKIGRDGIKALKQYERLKSDEASRISAAMTAIGRNVAAILNA